MTKVCDWLAGASSSRENTSVDFTPNELRVDVIEDTTRRSDSAVRLTHLPSGIAVTVEDQPTQIRRARKRRTTTERSSCSAKRPELRTSKYVST